MSISIKTCLFLFFFLFLFCITGLLFAKSYTTEENSAQQGIKNSSSVFNTSEFESRFTPYFESRAGLVQYPKEEIATPSDMDIFAIVRNWDRLSAVFKETYTQSISIPDEYISYSSPGGNFEIYYTIEIESTAVDSTDTLGFGMNGNEWRKKTSEPNGIPDYVDIMAWTMDSAWSMEIERFGFPEPYPYTDKTHPSDKYKILLWKAANNNYGVTYPYPVEDSTGIPRFASLIEIQSSWENFNDYKDRPYEALNVTGVHEFFHSIQYSMGRTRSPYIDYFPRGWLEGTAVMMEELGFDHINDYLQYVSNSNNKYFGNIGEGIFIDDYSILDSYSNVIASLYLYHHTFQNDSMFFIKNIFEENQEMPGYFSLLLDNTAEEAQTTWPSLLNNFHASSFFTGDRGNTDIFLPDSDTMPQWDYPMSLLEDYLDTGITVKPQGAGIAGIDLSRTALDSVRLILSSTNNTAALSGRRRASIILLDSAGTALDSIIRFPLQDDGSGTFYTSSFSGAYNKALIIISNGHHSTSDNMTLWAFHGNYMSFATGESLLYDAYGYEASALLSVHITENTPGKITLDTIPYGSGISRVYDNSSMLNTSIFFEVSFPEYMTNSADFSLKISCKNSFLLPKNLSIFKLDTSYLSFQKIDTEFENNSDSSFWECSITAPGIYTLSGRTDNEIYAYPNPVRINRDKQINFAGTNLKTVTFFTLSGTMIARVNCDKDTSSLSNPEFNSCSWHLENKNGSKIIPGTYIAVTKLISQPRENPVYRKKKVLILP